MEKCPRSMNHRPDDFSAADCIAAGECGCRARPFLLTDDIIEKAARAGYHSVRSHSKHRDMLPLWENQSPVLQGIYRTNYRAALEAVLPDLMEKAAKRCELLPDSGYGFPAYNAIRRKCAAAIRSLAKKDEP